MKPLKIPEEKASFGEAVNWARHERRMTIRALAEKLECSPAYIVDLEHDRRKPNKVEEIATALNVDLDDLRARAGCTPVLRDWLSQNPKLIRLLHDIRMGRCKPNVMKAMGLR